jgi:curved DNA-binding protein CbpA
MADPPLSMKTKAAGAFRPSLIPGAPPSIPKPSMAPLSDPSGIRAAARIFESDRPHPSGDDPRARLLEQSERVADGDPYAVLGVTRDATTQEIQTAFLRAAKAWHPDRLPEGLSDLRDRAAKVFARASEAHRLLSDPRRRADYDATIDRAGVTDERQEVERALEASTEHQKAEVLLKRGDLASAERLVAHAVELDPDHADYAALLAWVRAQRSQAAIELVEATKLLDRAIGRDPDNDRALYFRGAIYKRLGRSAEALRDFRAAAEINPRNVDAVREVRLFHMRARATNPPPAPDDKKGLIGRLFKK